MTCPTCGTELMGLGTWCSNCERYVQREDPNVMRVVLPLAPVLTNKRWHWRKVHKRRTEYYALCDAWRAAGLVPRPPETPWTRTKARAHLYVWNKRDPTNAVASLKWPEDWLVQNGYLEDDRAENIEWDGIPKQTIDRKRTRVELVLERAA